MRNILLLTSMVAAYEVGHKQRCFWPFSDPKPVSAKNRIKGRMQSLQYPANDPMEDALVMHELKNV
jgi:hypothetical protein